MNTDDYQAKLKAMGIDRGKLETGFKDSDDRPTQPETSCESPCASSAPPVADPQRAPAPAAGKPVMEARTPDVSLVDKSKLRRNRVVNNSVNKCRCGVTISGAAKRCRKCFRQDMSKTWKAAESGVSLAPGPSLPPAPPPPAEDEPAVLWSVLGEPEIAKIAEAVIRGNGGLAQIDDITAAVEELTRNQVGSMLCTLVLRGEIGIRCQKGKVSYARLDEIARDWDYVI